MVRAAKAFCAFYDNRYKRIPKEDSPKNSDAAPDWGMRHPSIMMGC
jgi:hypothetical protein